MVKNNLEAAFISDIALLYYTHNLTQAEIAERYNISRPKVSRLLAEARDSGIVKVFIDCTGNRNVQIEDALMQLFPLKTVRVVPVPENDPELALEISAQETAAYFSTFIQSGDRIGISWGYSLYTLVKHFPNIHLNNCEIYQINGNIDYTSSKSKANEIIDILSQKLSTDKAYNFPCPAILESPFIRDTLMNDSKIQQMLRNICSCNKLIINFSTATDTCCLYKSDYLKKQDIEELRLQNAVGSICCHYINSEAQICNPVLDRRTLAIPLESIKMNNFVFAYISNAEKVPVLYASLKAGYINILSIDSNSAKLLLALAKGNTFPKAPCPAN